MSIPMSKPMSKPMSLPPYTLYEFYILGNSTHYPNDYTTPILSFAPINDSNNDSNKDSNNDNNNDNKTEWRTTREKTWEGGEGRMEAIRRMQVVRYTERVFEGIKKDDEQGEINEDEQSKPQPRQSSKKRPHPIPQKKNQT
eukprot:CAMPEP_0118649528 /NCGR_PEP_ID=MMETSP0785-20121206/9753_1 /TAXON_ID=91992 /ORGANISM="Bolidomonas pacifica, Strain CCMP 1866" /LENGTH=140 /DNA_ID=CAMNT_0006541825 /DNA_START=101 /DNA_END=523 /DNA_ORIENTATION=-